MPEHECRNCDGAPAALFCSTASRFFAASRLFSLEFWSINAEGLFQAR
jgi:hypothetical protein